jgi:hypothetical protein
VKKLATLAALSAGAVLAMSALGWGGGNSRVPTKAENFSPRAVHPVAAPSVSLKRGGGGAGIKYFQTDPFTVPGEGRDDSFVRCPRGHKAITGYYGTDGGIVADWFTVGAESSRNWEFGLIDLTGTDGEAFLGIVCKD